MTPRIVLDTNVYISALRYDGKPEQVVNTVREGEFQLLISTPLREELARVLREKFSYTPQEFSITAASLWKHAEWIAPRRRLNLCSDEADNRVLEFALEGKADCIVAGDRHLLNLPPIERLAILTPDAFLARFAAAGNGN